MASTILLYGATGYSGRLIAEELRDLEQRAPGAFHCVLAGRDATRVQALAEALGMDWSAFELEDREAVQRAVGDLDTRVLLNAAGPFARTAPTLVDAAISCRCHYVDINGEADVYETLRDSAHRRAVLAKVAAVGAAGAWAAASNLLLSAALEKLGKCELGVVRIAMSRIRTFSRGSAHTVWRMLRNRVILARKGPPDRPPEQQQMLLWHEPVGKLERSFDYSGTPGQHHRRIASAASLVDTLAARLLLARRKQLAEAIESYVEAGEAARMAYQLGATLAPVIALPQVQLLARQPLALLADGPSPQERMHERHVVLLQVEDRLRTPLVDWRWETPNVYQFSAQLAAGVARELASGTSLKGWVLPAEVLGALDVWKPGHDGPLRGCSLLDRRT